MGEHSWGCYATIYMQGQFVAVWPKTGETVTCCFLEQKSAASVSFKKQVMLSVFTSHMAKYSSVSSLLLSRGGLFLFGSH